MGTLIDGVTNIYGAPRGAWVVAFGRRDSVFVSVCLSQDGRSNHMSVSSSSIFQCGHHDILAFYALDMFVKIQFF